MVLDNLRYSDGPDLCPPYMDIIFFFSAGTMYVIFHDYLVEKWIPIYVWYFTAYYFIYEFRCS